MLLAETSPSLEPIVVALIGVAGTWFSIWRTLTSRRRASALEGFDELTTQMQKRIDKLEFRDDQKQRDLDECLAGRISLQKEIGRLTGELIALRAELRG